MLGSQIDQSKRESHNTFGSRHAIYSCINMLNILHTDLFTRQRDTTGLSAENAELKIRLQAIEQQAQLRDGEHLFIFS